MKSFNIQKQLKTFLIRMELYNSAVKVRDVLRSIRFLPNNIKMWYDGKPDGLPYPPLELIGLVAGPRDIKWFLEGGRLAFESIKEILEKHGIHLRDLKTILDFGCGCGRALRYFKSLPEDVQVYGVDYNHKLIDWCTDNLKFAKFETNDLNPPLNFPNESIDLVYSLSVFTHLPEEIQLKWIDELWRIIKPGGFLILSTHGEHYRVLFNSDEERLFNAGKLVLRDQGKIGSNAFGVYHPMSYVKTILCKNFTLVDFLSEGAKGNPYQDLYLFRKL